MPHKPDIGRYFLIRHASCDILSRCHPGKISGVPPLQTSRQDKGKAVVLAGVCQILYHFVCVVPALAMRCGLFQNFPEPVAD